MAEIGHSRREFSDASNAMLDKQHQTPSPPKGPSWDDLAIGLVVGPLTHTITPEMVADFCAALPTNDRPYRAGATCEEAIMPPTLLTTDYIPLLHGKLELGWGLMARHSLKMLKPVRVNDTVVVTGEIVDKYVRKGRHYWTLSYRVHDSAGDLCLENLITCSVD